MSITIEDVRITNPKGFFLDPIIFDIEFECSIPISTYIRWEVIYVGSAKSPDFDQTLTSVLVGPIDVGMNRFVLKADPPKFENIPPDEINLTVTMLKAYYKDQEFIKMGYYVQNALPIDWDQNNDVSKIERQIIVDDFTVQTRQIKWS